MPQGPYSVKSPAERVFDTEFHESQPAEPEIFILKFSVHFTVALKPLNPLQATVAKKYMSA